MQSDVFTRLRCSRTHVFVCMSIRALARLPFKPCAHMRIPGARFMELCACITRVISSKIWGNRSEVLMGAVNASV